MYSYTLQQWIFFFYFYCFFGWCFESTYVSLKSRKLTNRGFMRGPFLPIYGSGAIMMLVVSIPFQDSILLTYFAGCVGATILEYVTGVVMEALFKVRYWDYSNQKFNYKGHICLSSTLAWGGLTILMTEWLHIPVEKIVLAVPEQVLTGVTLILTAIVFADFALSVKAAIDLRDVLIKMEQAMRELEHVQKRLDIIIALANQELEERKGHFNEQVSKDIKSGIESRLEHIRLLSKNMQWEHRERVREEISELKAKYIVNLENRLRLGDIHNSFIKGLLKANPTMTSVRFGEALQELKWKVLEHKKNDKSDQTECEEEY